jgi:5'-nucleotidase
MLILLVNDDGIHGPGLEALENALSDHQTFTVAPIDHCSGAGMSLGLYAPLSVIPLSSRRFAVTGTPVDCVKIALSEILPKTPDLVVSGINPGANLGNNIWYSGTVGAATEASFWRIPSVAVSVERSPEVCFQPAADLVRRMVEEGVSADLPPGVVLNVNLPPGKPKGLRFTSPGSFAAEVPFVRNSDGTYSYGPYELQGIRETAGTDIHAILDGYASITPLASRREFKPVPERMREWFLNSF